MNDHEERGSKPGGKRNSKCEFSGTEACFIKDNVAGAAQWGALVAANVCVVNWNVSIMWLKDHPSGHMKNKL